MSHAFPTRSLPKELERLTELALDLRLTGSPLAARLWQRLDPDAWERTNNPYMILMNAHQDRLDELAADQELQQELQTWLDSQENYLSCPMWYGQQHGGKPLGRVAYFSMEFGLSEALPIYSGGLGILAGDHLKSASDLGVPLVGIGLLYQQGYFRQVLASDGGQLEAFPFNDPGTLPICPVLDSAGRWPLVRLDLPGRTLLLRVWQVRVGRVTLYLLDSNHPLNSPWDRGITANLYAAGKDKRLLQELVLGVGGWRLLEKLGIEAEVCHLNEGHAAFAVLERAHSFARGNSVSFDVALRATRAGNVFTTHTPVAAAFDQFDVALLEQYAGPLVDSLGISMRQLLAMGRREAEDDHEPFNMAYLAMRGCCQVNAVSRLHGRVSQRLFQVLFLHWPEPEVPVGAITNGVHVATWDSGPADGVWRQAYQGPGPWTENLEQAAQGMASVDDTAIWNFRAAARMTLVEYVRRRLGRQLRQRGATSEQLQAARHILDPNYLTLGFARRFTEYKRPTLLLHDADRLARILRNSDRPVQIVMAGKAHPNDDQGKAMVQAIARFCWRDDVRDRAVFLEDYDMVLARHLATGVDVWLNNPRRPAEACGTSGMKMLANGGLQFSELDGWWDECYSAEVGWALGDGQDHCGPEWDAYEANQFYEILEQQVAPEFYNRDVRGVPHAWIQKIRASMTQLTPRFSSHRMVRDYVEQAYLPAAEAYARRVADDCRLARELEAWQQQLDENWCSLRFGLVRVTAVDDSWHFEVQAYLGDLPAPLVRVELYAEPKAGQTPRPVGMLCEGPIAGAVNGFLYTATLPADRPADDFTPRMVPVHEEAFVPLETSHLTWQH